MRDHDPILGDLIEEYREGIRPTRGPVRASFWFARQILSFIPAWTWGVLLGVVLGGLNLASAAVAPLAEDTLEALLIIATVVLGSWTAIGFAAERRRFRIGDSLVAGLVAALLTTVITSVANLTRKIVFLDIIQHRSDWQGLLIRFHESGSADLKAFVIAEHLHGLIGGIAFSAVVGALCGAIGGAISASKRAPASPSITEPG
jgi:hypothetical protein